MKSLASIRNSFYRLKALPIYIYIWEGATQANPRACFHPFGHGSSRQIYMLKICFVTNVMVARNRLAKTKRKQQNYSERYRVNKVIDK